MVKNMEAKISVTRRTTENNGGRDGDSEKGILTVEGRPSYGPSKAGS